VDLSDDAILNGRLRLLQPVRGHRFGHDALLLAAATEARDGEHAVDLGSGVGAAGLALACRVAALRVTLVEVDPALSELARKNIIRNGFDARVDVVTADATMAASLASAGLDGGTADHVLMNPPFNDPVRQSASPDPQRRRAHVAAAAGPQDWIASAAHLLKPGGILTLIWRAEDSDAVVAAVGQSFGRVAVRPVIGRAGKFPVRVLVQGRKDGVTDSVKAIRTLPPLYLTNTAGKETPLAEDILRKVAALPFVGPEDDVPGT
jgi:tRNA1(Val) A37 N6-methylase TrmN6